MASRYVPGDVEKGVMESAERSLNRRNANERTLEAETTRDASRQGAPTARPRDAIHAFPSGYADGISIVTSADIHVPLLTEETATEKDKSIREEGPSVRSCRLIDEHGSEVIRSENSNGVPLLCDAIVHQQLHGAELFMESASERDLFVDVDTGECPTLDWAIKTRSADVAKFVLDTLAKKLLSVEVSRAILTHYVFPLIEQFPELMSDYLENDKFSFEYGRFMVPYSLFEKNGRCPIAMTTDEELDDWTMPNSAATKDFWMDNSEQYAAEMDKKSVPQVVAVAKFFCIDLNRIRSGSSANNSSLLSKLQKWSCCRKHLLERLASSNLPIRVFKSESIRSISNWVFYSLYSRFLCLLILDIATAVLFSLFTGIHGLRHAEHDEWKERFSLFLIIATFLLSLITMTIRFSKIKCATRQYTGQGSDVRAMQIPQRGGHSVAGNSRRRFFRTQPVFCLLDLSRMHSLLDPGNPSPIPRAFVTDTAFCMCMFVQIVEALRPFDRIGHFVSVVIYSFRAIIPFCALLASILIGFAFSFRILFNVKFYDDTNSDGVAPEPDEMLTGHARTRCRGDDDDYGDLSSFFHVLKILFQAAAGNFEEKVPSLGQSISDSHDSVYLGFSINAYIHWRVEITPVQRLHLRWRDCDAQPADRHPERHIHQRPIHSEGGADEMSGKDGRSHSVYPQDPHCSTAHHLVSDHRNELTTRGLSQPSCVGNSVMAELRRIGQGTHSRQARATLADFIWVLKIDRISFTI